MHKYTWILLCHFFLKLPLIVDYSSTVYLFKTWQWVLHICRQRINVCSWAPEWFILLEEIQQLYTHANLAITKVKVVLLNVVINCLCKCTKFSHCWPLDSSVTCLREVGSTFSTCFLYCCRVSSAALLRTQGGQGLAWVNHPPTHTLFPGRVLCISGSRHFPDITSYTICTSAAPYVYSVLKDN